MRPESQHAQSLWRYPTQNAGTVLHGPRRPDEEDAESVRVPGAPETPDAKEEGGGVGSNWETACSGGLRERVRRVQRAAGEREHSEERGKDAGRPPP